MMKVEDDRNSEDGKKFEKNFSSEWKSATKQERDAAQGPLSRLLPSKMIWVMPQPVVMKEISMSGSSQFSLAVRNSDNYYYWLACCSEMVNNH
jgi:hypothetical protein